MAFMIVILKKILLLLNLISFLLTMSLKKD